MAYPSSACYNPQRTSWLPFWMDDDKESACKNGTATGNIFTAAAAQLYELTKYGEIPRIYAVHTGDAAAPPTGGTPTNPTPGRLADPTWTPEEAAARGYDQWRAAVQAKIAEAEAAGDYVPAGRYSSPWEIPSWVWIAAAATGAVILYGAVKR